MCTLTCNMAPVAEQLQARSANSSAACTHRIPRSTSFADYAEAVQVKAVDQSALSGGRINTWAAGLVLCLLVDIALILIFNVHALRPGALLKRRELRQVRLGAAACICTLCPAACYMLCQPGRAGSVTDAP